MDTPGASRAAAAAAAAAALPSSRGDTPLSLEGDTPQAVSPDTTSSRRFVFDVERAAPPPKAGASPFVHVPDRNAAAQAVVVASGRGGRSSRHSKSPGQYCDPDTDDSDFEHRTPPTIGTQKRKRSGGGGAATTTTRHRGPKRQAMIRRERRLQIQRAEEGERRRKEQDERIAREAARRKGFQGNMICAAGVGASGAGAASSGVAAAEAGSSGAAAAAASSAAAAGTSETKAGDFFWEIDEYLDRRDVRLPGSGGRKQIQVLIKWKNCDKSEATWEPLDNMCQSAYDDAIEWWKMEKERRARMEENERKLGLLPAVTRQEENVVAPDKSSASGGHKQEDGDVNMTEAAPSAGGNEHISSSSQAEEEEVTAPAEPEQEQKTEPEPVAVEDPNWEWNDASQVNFRKVKRVSVNDDNAKEVVTEARINGIPVVLTGHAGWANFATRWLRRKQEEVAEVSGEAAKTTDESAASTVEDGTGTANNGSSQGTEPATLGKNTASGGPTPKLDLSDPTWYLDVKAMSDDIGMEEVPVVKRNYDESAPISANVSAAKFLEASWPNAVEEVNTTGTGNHDDANDGADGASKAARHMALYLHQWQFPLSESAAPKLCNQSEPLPNDILGEDLLRYWIDHIPDCPLQYLFMGREETMSKIHKDPGGLAISIAPIVGEKECVLVHRDDGQQCLYHLYAPLDPENIDLDGYPLLSQARVWKTTIKPGEILLMPQGTYHQCRNVTPCLSYSRFHLDAVNLRPFLQSLFDGDAPELEQDDILWNCVQELMKVVDKATDETKKTISSCENDDVQVVRKKQLDPTLVRTVDTLRSLRHMVREITRKLAVRQTVKGKAAGSNLTSDEGASLKGSSKIDGGAAIWQQLVDDIDLCLHEFRYRYSKHDPAFMPRRSQGKKRLAMPSAVMRGPSASTANERWSGSGTSRAAGTGSRTKKSYMNGSSSGRGKNKKGKSGPGANGLRRIIPKNVRYTVDMPADLQCPKITSRGKPCMNCKAPNSSVCHLHGPKTYAPIDSAYRPSGTSGKANKATSIGQQSQRSRDAPIVAFDNEMERAYLSLPVAPTLEQMSQVNLQGLATNVASITPGARITVRIQGRKCRAEVLEVAESLYCAQLSYEDYPSLYDEFQPCDLLRMPSSGGGCSEEVNPENIRPGLLVVSLVGEKRDEYRGIIEFTKCEKMFRAKMSFGKTTVERWIDSDSIISVDTQKDKSLLPKAGFLSSEEQWGQRAARQQGIDATSSASKGDTLKKETDDDEEDVICGSV